MALKIQTPSLNLEIEVHSLGKEHVELVKKVLEEIRKRYFEERNVAIELSSSCHGPYIDGAYRRGRTIETSDRRYIIMIEYRTNEDDTGVADAIVDMIDKFFDEMINDASDTIVEYIRKRYGIDASVCDWYEGAIDICDEYDTRITSPEIVDGSGNSGVGFSIGRSILRPLREILEIVDKEVKEYLKEIDELQELVDRHYYRVVELILRRARYDVVKTWRSGNSTVVPLRLILHGKHVKRYVVDSGRLECFEVVD